jgi:RNA recognition motif-containing protein
MSNSLLLSNVPFDTSDEDLRQWLEDRQFSVLSITLIRDVVSGTSPSFAYVQFAASVNLKDAESILVGQSFKGRTLSVSRIVPKRSGGGRQRAAGSGSA